MKKTYMTPELEVISIKTAQMMASSPISETQGLTGFGSYQGEGDDDDEVD